MNFINEKVNAENVAIQPIYKVREFLHFYIELVHKFYFREKL